MTESDLQIQVAEYLVRQYPDVMFHSDFGSGTKLTPGQAKKQKRQNGGRRAWPDMTIAEAKVIIPRDPVEANKYSQNHWVIFPYQKGEIKRPAAVFMAGLYLELKKEGTKLIRDKDARKILKGETKLRKRGDWWDLHTEEQALTLEKLRERGYCAEFAIGFDEAKKIIDEYLGGK